MSKTLNPLLSTGSNHETSRHVCFFVFFFVVVVVLLGRKASAQTKCIMTVACALNRSNVVYYDVSVFSV